MPSLCFPGFWACPNQRSLRETQDMQEKLYLSADLGGGGLTKTWDKKKLKNGWMDFALKVSLWNFCALLLICSNVTSIHIRKAEDSRDTLQSRFSIENTGQLIEFILDVQHLFKVDFSFDIWIKISISTGNEKMAQKERTKQKKIKTVTLNEQMRRRQERRWLCFTLTFHCQLLPVKL